MDINFILANCSYLKYYLPLIIEFNKKKMVSTIFLMKSMRYSDPYLNMKHIRLLSSEYSFKIDDISNIKSHTINFLIEGSGYKRISKDEIKISLTALTDFQILYDDYIDNVDYVVFPSRYFAEYYRKLSGKNLYLGSPKYDVDFDLDTIKKKYKIQHSKNALILFPRNRDISKIGLSRIYNCIRELGYNIIVKTRGKDKVGNLRGDQYFEDFSWFPHTSMELIFVCDFVINFDSTAIKECVMLNTPLINFRIKPFVRPMDFLYNYSYCKNLNIQSNETEIKSAICEISKELFIEEFSLSRKKYLFEKEGIAKKIVDFVIGLK